MKTFLFTCSGDAALKAVSLDSAGANLPVPEIAGSSWTPAGHIDLDVPESLSGDGIVEQDMLRDLHDQGWSVFRGAAGDPVNPQSDI